MESDEGERQPERNLQPSRRDVYIKCRLSSLNMPPNNILLIPLRIARHFKLVRTYSSS